MDDVITSSCRTEYIKEREKEIDNGDVKYIQTCRQTCIDRTDRTSVYE